MNPKIKEALCIIAMVILFAIASFIGALLGKKMADHEIQRLYEEGIIENAYEEAVTATK